MGQLWLPNKGLSNKLRSKLYTKIEGKIQESKNYSKEQHRWIVLGFYTVTVYVVSLRGPEGILLDLDGLNRNWNEQREDFLVLALLRKVKGESHDRSHLIPCANVTASGIEIRKITQRFLEYKRKLGFTDGPAILDTEGKLLRIKDLDDMIHEVLIEIYEEKKTLFPMDITSHDLIIKH